MYICTQMFGFYGNRSITKNDRMLRAIIVLKSLKKYIFEKFSFIMVFFTNITNM